jgi:hypothetical protein
VIDPAHPFETGCLLAVPDLLLGDLIAGLNPFCLAMYPAAATSCCATCNTETPAKNALHDSLMFVLGAAVATSLLGMGGALLGRVMGQSSRLGGWHQRPCPDRYVPLLVVDRLSARRSSTVPRTFCGAWACRND